MYEFSKRALDIVGAAIGIVLVSPLIAIIAVLVKRDSHGPVFFRQERLGRNGEPFTMVKFRTMVADNDETAHREYMERHVKGESESRINDEGGEVFLLDDDRVTPFGSRLRRTSLDELPNLVNVLRGPMSLVGPRPPIPYEVEHYDERAMRRLTVKPGMTGYAQISGRGSLTFDTMITCDLRYIDERSLWTDLKILAGTVPAVLGRRGV